MSKAESLFEKAYGKAPEYTDFVPYRICTLGAHIDHQHGNINGFAIDKGMNLSYSRSHGRHITIVSANFEGEFDIDTEEMPVKSGNWGDFVKAALWVLKTSGYDITEGFEGVISGSMPIGGLSSSAAVSILYINALCRINGISLNERELIDAAQKAEHDFVGLNCGKLDQSCEVLCRKDSLLLLDNLDGKYENIGIPGNADDFEIGIFFSGLEHVLVNSKYNLRTDELRAAAYILKAFETEDYSRMNEYVLRDVPEEIFLKYGDRLPDNFRKRCEHYYSENKRALKGPELFRKGDIRGYGSLVFESGISSVNNYECGSPELISLFNILRSTDGVFGARFNGAGFKGCCMALVNPGFKDEIAAKVKEEYLKLYPGFSDSYSCTFCRTADGFGCTK